MAHIPLSTVKNICLVAVSLAFASPALAEDNSAAQCANENNAFSFDVQIGGCTVIINEAISSGNIKITSPVYYTRGNGYLRKGDDRRAIADYNTAIRLDPLNERAYLNRSHAYWNLGDDHRVVADYRQAVKINPQNASHGIGGHTLENPLFPIPGGTSANPELQRDTIHLLLTLETAYNSTCTSHPIVNTRVVGRPSAANKMTIKETWTIERCGVTKKYEINFIPDLKGGTFISIPGATSK
jgi:tetratricopeptide (TPR) repeat protein